MTQQQWKTAWDIYSAAREKPPSEARAFLDSVSADPEISQEVALLLDEPDQGCARPEQRANRESKIGDRIGRYVITGELGRGAMSQVYSARDTELQRVVALKILDGNYQGRLAPRRSIREAQAASGLNHPNIVTVHGVIQADSQLAIVMELVEGTTLRKLANGGKPLATGQVIQLGTQIARALSTAHAHGIVHRDLKPENIMLRRDGYVKILDFGLACDLVSDTVTTVRGLPIGTVSYMSPEQSRGEASNGASDIFSLGIILYELSTGAHPFWKQSNLETMRAIAEQEPKAPSLCNRWVSRRLDSLILGMLAKDPARRPDAAAVANALETIPLQDEATVASPHRAARWIAGLAAMVALVLLGLTVKNNWFRTTAPAASIQSLAVLPLQNLAHNGEEEYFVDGMTDHLITTLAQTTSLRVISRTSVMHYKDVKTTLRHVARELNVDAVVEGSVLRVAGKVRITAQLVDARTDRHLWAKSYEREQKDLFGVQDEVAQDIAHEVTAALRPAGQIRASHDHASLRGPVDPVAYENYLRGRYEWNKRTRQGMRMALQYFEKAIDADPLYPSAYAGLAETYAIIDAVNDGPSIMTEQESLPMAKAVSRKALALDQNLAGPHAALGVIAWHTWDWDAEDREMRKALALDPGYAVAHQWYAQFLSAMGRHEQAIAEYRRSLDLDPLSITATGTLP